MKKIISLLVYILISFSLSPFVIAQNPSLPTSEGMHWFCLSKVSADPYTHTAQLNVKEGSGYQEGVDTAVVVKIALAHEIKTAEDMDANSAMTTGNISLDDTLFGGHAGWDTLQGAEHQLKNAGIVGGTNPTKIFPITWKDDLAGTAGGAEDRAHNWYGVQEVAPVGDTAAGGAGAQQQGTFTFDQVGSTKDCDIIRWDPFGYVFDAQTQGPIAGVYVRILTSKTENGVYAPVPVGIGEGKVPQNPIATKKDGSYRYYVSPGYYKLELLGDTTQSDKKYIIEKNLSIIKPGFEEFGYEQVYIAETPEVIHELKGKVERRDIAIKTIGAPAPFSTEGPTLKDIIISRSMKKGEQMVRVSGMASQIPIDFNVIYKDVNNIVVGTKVFSLKHGHTYVPEGLHDERNFDMWIPAEIKEGTGVFKELKITSKYSNKEISLPINPMPSYLEGIAQTRTGTPIVGGMVGVYPVGSSKPSYVTKTDDKGRFSVHTEWIPPFPYELRYTSVTGDMTKVTTTDYLKQNATYHKENKIDSYSVKVTEPDPDSVKTNNRRSTPQPTGTQVGGIAASGMQGIVIVVITIILLVMIGVGAFLIMRSKQQQPPPLV